jgi:electron transport complex protein RnfG
MSSFKTFGIPAIVLFSICLVSTFLLALTNKVTSPQIQKLNAQSEEENRKLVLSQAESFSDKKTVSFNGEEYEYYEGIDDNGKCIGYVFTTTEKGYGGDIRVMAGVKTDGTVDSVRILELNETAGLGMNAQDESFLSQFKGLVGGITVSKDKPGGNSIDALTGATITSRAVTAAVNDALELYDAVSGGGQ